MEALMANMLKIVRQSDKSVLILSLLFMTSVLGATEKEAPVAEITLDTQKAATEREQFSILAEGQVRAANEAFKNKKYQEAIDAYIKAINFLERCSLSSQEVKSRIESCRKQINRCYEFWSRELYLQAMDELKVQNLTVAIELCEKGSLMYPPSKARNDALIEKYKKEQEKLAFKSATQESSVLPDLEQRKYKIDLLLRAGTSLMNANQLDKARNKFEEVLIIDPYNTDAINKLYKVNTLSLTIAAERKNAVHNERMAENSWKGVNTIIPKTFTGGGESINSPVKKEIVEDSINNKLKNIIIDHIEFEEVTIPTVVKYLKMRSKQIDPDNVGVNFFIRKISTAGGDAGAVAAPAAAPAAPVLEDPFGAEDPFGQPKAATPATATEEPSNMPTVTMVVSNISLLDAVRYICRAANLKYKIEKYAVVIASQDVPLDDVETRIYPIEHESIDSIGGGDAEVVKQHFVGRGVPFPAGAKIVYDNRISRLIATNTPENLRKIEAIIHNELNTVDPQVLIQAKFVEVSQNDLDELGFDYSLSRELTGNNPISGQPFSKESRGRVEFGKNDSLVRNRGGDTALSFTHFANGWSFAATVYALDQCDSQDILSTPRITTLNGQEATIRMVEEVYYPSDWSEAETATTSGENNSTRITSFVSSIPEFDDPYELGIVLRVTPHVDADQYTITLNMNPQIQRFAGWTDYSYDVAIAGRAQPVTNIIKQPIIAARTVETTVSVYDGETIVLGGIIKDTIQNIDDNIPILGKIPLIGRFFQTKSTRKEKTNLLIFLTCRLVNPDGTPIRERQQRGLPEFRR